MTTVDTNVLVYSLDDHEPAKQLVARELLLRIAAEDHVVLLWQVACELLACLQRWSNAGRLTPTQVEL